MKSLTGIGTAINKRCKLALPLHAVKNMAKCRQKRYILGDLHQKIYQPSVILSNAKDLLVKQKQILRYRSKMTSFGVIRVLFCRETNPNQIRTRINADERGSKT